MTSRFRARRGSIAVAVALAAFVLGAAYLVSKPGSDEPATNGADAGPNFEEIEGFVQDEMAAQRIPGLALGIVEGARVAYVRGFGTADDSGTEVTPQTPFIIGSVSKSLTALAVMQLVEVNRIELDAPVRQYLPWFRVADEKASAEITVRHLLNHTSGLSTKTGRSFQGDGDTSDTALEQAVRKLDSAELTEPVGSKHQYSTINYSVLGLIVQTVAGQPYERFVQTRIFDPLQMGDSFTSEESARASGSRDRTQLLVRPAAVSRSALQPRARAGGVPHFERGGHDPLPDLSAQRRSVRPRIGPLARWDQRASPSSRPDPGSGHLIRHGLVRGPCQRDCRGPPSRRNVQLPLERRAHPAEP